MSVKDDIAKILEKSRGEFVSGQELAQRLGCTRGAVWKAVRTLQKQGFAISAVTNKGYRLDEDCDVLSVSGVEKYLGKGAHNVHIELLDSTDSTNNVIRSYAQQGMPEGTVVIAREQTSGRGRLGRSFYSPQGTGLYMSILLRPAAQIGRAVRITTCAALAVCDAIEAATGAKAGIKWVNDVYLEGKKVCGILTEASVSMESGGLDHAVLGIGLNVYEPQGGFPEEIADIAGAVTKNKTADLKNKLAGGIIGSFMRYYAELEQGSFQKAYSKRLMWKGEEIFVISGENKTPCTLVDVDEECRLCVHDSSGASRLISSGEISIRKR